MQQPKTGAIMREFASFFKNKKPRMRYPYIRLTENRITCTDFYIVLDYKSTDKIADFKGMECQAVYIKAEHAGQFSRNDFLTVDETYVEGVESGLIVPHAKDQRESPARLFESVDRILKDEFMKIGSTSRDRANSAVVNTDFMRRVFQAFKNCGFDKSTVTINGTLEPLCIEAVETYLKSVKDGKRMDAFTMRALAMPIKR